ncbi:hypothetical protein OHU34_43300 [Streptomyces sp. NBC_00080]|uniref:DUF6059 family protein n=1 Tax=unclassified Streptomyces TaxID=2593676 RepID=UPI0011513C4B|nr:DUF6059 family protein [Streptomyces sp. SLBN-115]TQJ37100.1 hypothetical protein FBY34_8610 [Streptomyces sp. SLBN-115]
MEGSARDTPYGLPRYPTAAERATAIVVRRCVLPVWRSLKAYGLMCLGLVGHDEAPGPDKTPAQARPPARREPGLAARHGPLPAYAGPPPGHPERLRPDMPLTEAERALARQLSGPLTGNDPTPG